MNYKFWSNLTRGLAEMFSALYLLGIVRFFDLGYNWIVLFMMILFLIWIGVEDLRRIV